MKNILLLATTTGYQIRSFGEAAEKLGARLVFASDCCDQLDDPWYDHAIPVRFHDENRSMDAIAAAFADGPPDGILAVGDRPAALAALAAERFGLPGHPSSAARASRNKRATRQALQRAGLPTPSFRSVSIHAREHDLAGAVPYPAVLKPLALSGSRGVIRVNDATEFVAAFARLRRLLNAVDVRSERDAVHDEVMIESFIPGKEFALEGLLEHGSLRTLAIFDKPDPLDGPFFEETIYVTPSREGIEVRQHITDGIAAATRALGLHHGPVHAECRVNSMGVFVLEVAARPIGGLCARALRFTAPDGAHASLEELLLQHATGDDVSGYGREAAAAGVMMIPIPRRGFYKGVEGIEEARAVAGIEDVRVTAKPDTLLVPLPEGKSYLGFLFARGSRPELVEQALRDAHARLHFLIEREIAVVGPA